MSQHGMAVPLAKGKSVKIRVNSGAPTKTRTSQNFRKKHPMSALIDSGLFVVLFRDDILHLEVQYIHLTGVNAKNILSTLRVNLVS